MLTLEQIPMRQDNYSYALIKDHKVIMIDPSEPDESLRYFSERPHLELIAILNTHSHLDHVAGNDVLAQKYKVPVFGPMAEKERVPALTHAVSPNEVIELSGLRITAHDVHAHTIGHTAYMVHAHVDEIIKRGHHQQPFVARNLSGHRVMFVGDSLFAAGCGRLFEGTRENLRDCLAFYHEQARDILMACAHEYTKSNLFFAQAMFPDDAAIKNRAQTIDNILAEEGASVPCLFGLEHDTNPFLLALNEPHRTRLAQMLNVDARDDVAVIGALRAAKDNF